MLFHVSFDSSNQADLVICTFSVSHTAYLWNHIPRGDTSLSPIELFSEKCLPLQSHLKYLHLWGCPVFVSDLKLQDGPKLLKGIRQACLGKYLGYPSEHSTIIGLVRNLSKCFVSPQFHLVNEVHFSPFSMTSFFATITKLVQVNTDRITGEMVEWDALTLVNKDISVDTSI